MYILGIRPDVFAFVLNARLVAPLVDLDGLDTFEHLVVVDVDFVFRGVESEVVGLANRDARFHAPAREPH